MRYRAEIDGLRAVAVIPVILFHAGFSHFSGGFVGVDVFFVISGYLITTIILDELDRGKFSIVNFYERRARRILPALFLVMAVCLPFAWFWLVPQDLKEFSQSLVAVSTFVSNILFWRQSGYFDAAAELKPLLHTWSLAVEEQFYVFFPLFLMIVWRFGKKWILVVLVFVSLFSLVLVHYAASKSPMAAFFLLPTRAWELSIGCFVAFYLKRNSNDDVSKIGSQPLSLIGLLLILFSIFVYDKETPFPSLYALAPTVGTALIILFATQKTYVGELLGTKSFVGVGLVSYSAYLWHYPLFAFARHRSLGEPSEAIFIALSVITLILAYLSWRFVELPFRQKGIINRVKVFYFVFFGSLMFIVIGSVGHFRNGFDSRSILPSEILGTFERTKRSAECFDKKNVHEREDWLCEIGVAGRSPSFLVVGDSHLLSVLELFDSAAKAEGISGVFTGASGCPPLIGVYALRGDQNEKNCNKLNQRIFDYVAASKINKVILVGRWTYYTDGGYAGDNFSYLGLSPDGEKKKAASRKAFEYGVEVTSQKYKDSGVNVYLIEQAPQQEFEPKQIYQRVYRSGELSEELLAVLSVSKQKHRNLQSYVTDVFSTKASEFNRVTLDDVFCLKDKCLVGDALGSYYFDDDHLSIYGASRVMDKARNILSGKKGG